MASGGAWQYVGATLAVGDTGDRDFVLDVLRTPYRIDIMQPLYYVLEDFAQLTEITQRDLMADVAEARQVAHACALARDMVNTPPNDLGPLQIETIAREIAEQYGAEIAVVTGDVAQGASREEGLAAIRLVVLANDVSLRNLIPGEISKSFGFYQSKPASAFSPVAVTPDELGGAWTDGRLSGALEVELNGKPLGEADAGVDMTFDFGTLIAHAAKTRSLCAGTIIGSGTVSNRGPDGGPGKTVARWPPCSGHFRSSTRH